MTFTRFRLAGADKEQKAIADKYNLQIEALKKQRNVLTDKKERAKLSAQIESIKKQCTVEQGRPNGFTEEEVFQPNPTFYLDPVDLKRDVNNPTVWDKSVSRSERRTKMRTTVHVSIGDKKFVSLPLVLHRPFPVDSFIKEVSVNRKKIGANFRWFISFTVLFAEARQEVKPGIMAVDLGWAKDSLTDADGRIRVAGVRVRKEDGTETFEEFCLPPSFATYAVKLNGIMSVRDSATNECFDMLKTAETTDAALSELLKAAQRSRSACKGSTPPTRHLQSAVWMLRKSDEGAAVSESALKSLHQARKDKTITTLQEAVDLLRDAGMSDVQSVLEAWYERFMHLTNWLENGRDNQLAFKKDYYRRFAHKLALENNVLLLDADNFAKLAKKPDAEKDAKQAKGDVRFLAAPAMLRDALVAAFETTLWNSMASSKTCSACGAINEKLGASRTFECTACGHTDEQFEVMAASLGENLPSAKTGFRRFATEADILYTIRQGIVLADISIADTVKLLSTEGVSLSRIQKLYKEAFKSITTQRINQVVDYTKKHLCDPVVAAKALQYPPSVVAAVKKSAGFGGGRPGASGVSTKGFIEKKQPLIDKALSAIKRYGDIIIEEHRANKLSGAVAINIAKAHAITAEKIKRCADEAVIRVTKDVQSVSLGTHRY